MSIISTATHAALASVDSRPGVQHEVTPETQDEKTPLQKYGEALTKYVPSEVVGIVTGIYALIVPFAKGTAYETEAALMIAAIGLLSLIGLYWLQLVATARKVDKNVRALSIPFKECALGELVLLVICYLLWVASLLALFLSPLMAVAAGVLSILFIHLAEPTRQIVVTEDCK